MVNNLVHYPLCGSVGKYHHCKRIVTWTAYRFKGANSLGDIRCSDLQWCAALHHRPAVEYIPKWSPTPTASAFKKRALRHRPRPCPVRLQKPSNWKYGRLAVLHSEQALPLGVDQDHGTWLHTEWKVADATVYETENFSR